MKLNLCILGSAGVLLGIAACGTTESSTQAGRNNRFGATGANNAQSTDTQFIDGSPTPSPSPLNAVNPEQPTVNGGLPTPTPAPAVTRDLPYGTPVPGKSGFVTSPHDPTAGYVDVRGFAPGQEVRCPYTQKIFLVP